MARKKQLPAPQTGTLIHHCTFTAPQRDSEAVTAIARALEANANALQALCGSLDRSAPMVSIGKID